MIKRDLRRTAPGREQQAGIDALLSIATLVRLSEDTQTTPVLASEDTQTTTPAPPSEDAQTTIPVPPSEDTQEETADDGDEGHKEGLAVAGSD